MLLTSLIKVQCLDPVHGPEEPKRTLGKGDINNSWASPPHSSNVSHCEPKSQEESAGLPLFLICVSFHRRVGEGGGEATPSFLKISGTSCETHTHTHKQTRISRWDTFCTYNQIVHTGYYNKDLKAG